LPSSASWKNKKKSRGASLGMRRFAFAALFR